MLVVVGVSRVVAAIRFVGFDACRRFVHFVWIPYGPYGEIEWIDDFVESRQ